MACDPRLRGARPPFVSQGCVDYFIAYWGTMDGVPSVRVLLVYYFIASKGTMDGDRSLRGVRPSSASQGCIDYFIPYWGTMEGDPSLRGVRTSPQGVVMCAPAFPPLHSVEVWTMALA